MADFLPFSTGVEDGSCSGFGTGAAARLSLLADAGSAGDDAGLVAVLLRCEMVELDYPSQVMFSRALLVAVTNCGVSSPCRWTLCAVVGEGGTRWSWEADRRKSELENSQENLSIIRDIDLSIIRDIDSHIPAKSGGSPTGEKRLSTTEVMTSVVMCILC